MLAVHELSEGNRRSRVILAVTALVAVAVMVVGCSGQSGSALSAPDEPVVTVTTNPESGATDVSPIAPVAAAASKGTFTDISLVNEAGDVVEATLSPDRTTFTAAEPLGYGATYTWHGNAIGTDNKQVAVEGEFTTVSPDEIRSAHLNIGDGREVGIAAPIIVKFDGHVENKAVAEKAMVVTTDPPTPGSWAWLPDDHGSRAHWRPQNYWAPGTGVHLDAKLYGLELGDGVYGATDLTLDFRIGRSQIVKAHVPSHRMQVVRGGETVMNIPVSYGEGNEARNVTRSGIHVVTEKFEDMLMSNPPYYENVRERFAVRISNNGEFIHANPATIGVQGASNVTNGCINLSLADAQQYFGMAMYGDPVEVTGTTIALSAADGDIYDWAIDWPTWQSMSALA